MIANPVSWLLLRAKNFKTAKKDPETKCCAEEVGLVIKKTHWYTPSTV